MIFFLDCEFNERPGLLELISIALVRSSDLESYYAVSCEFNYNNCNDWVEANVLPSLGRTDPKDLLTIKEEVIEFLGEEPEVWTDYGAYDWVSFCWLFGTMMDLPKGYPMFPRDLNQLLESKGLGRDVLPDSLYSSKHSALFDALDLANQYHYIMEEYGREVHSD